MISKEEAEKAYKAFFNTADGRKVLADLKEAFYSRPITTDSNHVTIIRAAQKDVVQYIIDIAGDNDHG